MRFVSGKSGVMNDKIVVMLADLNLYEGLELLRLEVKLNIWLNFAKSIM